MFDIAGLLGKFASSIASIWGFHTMSGLVKANIGLASVLIALIAVSFVFVYLAKKAFPAQGRDPVRMMVIKLMVKTMFAGMIFVLLFAIFAEGKKTIKEIKDSRNGISVYSTDHA